MNGKVIKMSDAKEAPATLEQLHQAYSQCVATYGDLKYRAKMMDEEAEALVPKMKEINQAAHALKQAQAEPKEEKAPEPVVDPEASSLVIP